MYKHVSKLELKKSETYNEYQVENPLILKVTLPKYHIKALNWQFDLYLCILAFNEENPLMNELLLLLGTT